MNSENSVSNWKLPLYKIYTDEEDVDLITKVIKRGTNWAIGPEIEEFEKSVRDYVGTDYCVALNSGTSALHATFLAYGFDKKSEIIVPSFSFISTVNSVLFVGSKPVFSDIEETNFGLDPELITEKITSNSRAIVPMDYGGLSCKIFDIKKISKEKNLILIEDAAEALGAKVKGKKVGSIADASIFSFCGNKVLTTGEGGAVVTNSKKIFEQLKLIRSHGRSDEKNYFNDPSGSKYIELGYNWRMSSITASLGISQMKKLDKIIKMRQENAEYISSRISKHKEIKILNPPDDYEHIYQMYTVQLANKNLRDRLHQHLTNKKIFSKVYFEPIHLTNYYRKKFNTKLGLLPKTERIADEVLTLPLYPNMTTDEKNYLIESIGEFFDHLENS